MQITDWFDFVADIHPGDTALVTPRLTVSFAQTRAMSVAAALELSKNGIGKGQIVAVQAVNPALQFVMLLALQRLGAITCLLPQELNRRRAALETVKFHWLLSDDGEIISSAKMLPIGIAWLTGLELTAKALPGEFKRPDDVCLISISSGTTSAPKPMAFSTGMLDQRIMARGLGDQGGRQGEKTMIQASLGGMNGVVSALGSLWCGGTAYIGFTPVASADIIARDRIERLYCPAPLLSRIAEAVVTAALDVSCLKQIIYEGDAVSAELLQRVTRRLCSNLINSFGTNEVSRIALKAVDLAKFHPEDMGFLYPWAEVEAVDEKDSPLPPGEEGHLRFRSPAMISGYLGNPEATAERFRNGWFYSDDIGRVTRDRRLVLSGRAKHFIHLESGRFNPVHIDHGFSGHPQIGEAASFGVPGPGGVDEIWLALVERAPISDVELLAFCADKFGAHAPRHFLRLDRLPRNESGKVLRGPLIELARKNA